MKVEADEEQSAVPMEQATRVGYDIGSTAPARKPKVEVETTNAESLALDSSLIALTYSLGVIISLFFWASFLSSFLSLSLVEI